MSHPWSDAFSSPLTPSEHGALGALFPELKPLLDAPPKGILALDNAAATPLHRHVREAMTPWTTLWHGNPANRLHPLGEMAQQALELSRLRVAESLLISPSEVHFVSCATEANNGFLRGIRPKGRRNVVLLGATEHASVRSTVEALKEEGSPMDWVILPVDSQGQISLEAFHRHAHPETLLAFVAMDANNETGILQQNLLEMAQKAKSLGGMVHVDGVQGFARGSFALNPSTLFWDSAVVSPSKLHGPKGAAVWAMRRSLSPRLRPRPLLTGGGHEAGLRSGTPNVSAIVGLAASFQLHTQERARRSEWLRVLGDTFESHLREGLDPHSPLCPQIVGLDTARVPGVHMCIFPGVNAMKLIEEAKVIAASVGSACKTLQATASHVLLAMGIPMEEALAACRISFGLQNTVVEAIEAAKILRATAQKLRGV